MSKKLLKINNDKELTYNADGYILGMNQYSYLFGRTYTFKEIVKIKECNPDKEIYVSVNRIIFNDELEGYKKELRLLDELELNGIIVGDVAALTYGLKTNVILDQMHLNNSYFTINHYMDNGLSGIVLTNDITSKEIEEIRKNTSSLLFKQVFGYPHLSTSNRMLITNYLTHFNVHNKSFSYIIKEEKSDDYYQVIQDNFGTHIFGSNSLNLLGIDLDVDYEIIDGYLMDDIKDVLDAFFYEKLDKKKEIDDKYNANDGFIDKETIYKVKKDER